MQVLALAAAMLVGVDAANARREDAGGLRARDGRPEPALLRRQVHDVGHA